MQAKTLRHVGVKTGQFIDYMANQVAGLHNLSCTHWDVQITLDVWTRAKVKDFDSNTIIVYFTIKA